MWLRAESCVAYAFVATLLTISSGDVQGETVRGPKYLRAEETDPKKLARLLIAPNGQYLSIVGISRPDQRNIRGFNCTGILIAATWVLTVADCIVKDVDALHRNTSVEVEKTPIEPEKIHVLIGNADLEKTTSVEVSSVMMHPNFHTHVVRNLRLPTDDVALLQLKAPVNLPVLALSRRPAPVVLRADEGTGSTIVVGWGKLVERGSNLPDGLMRHLSVKYIPNAECNRKESYDEAVRPTELCAASVFESIDVCHGFGGAPLISFDAQGRQFAVGLVTWGEGCARKSKPTVYADIGAYISWIEGHTGRLDNLPAVGLLRTIDISGGSDTGERLAGPNPNLAPTGLFRYVVSIGRAWRNQGLGHFCGGVLVTPKHVLTAAHCVKQYEGTPELLQLKIDSEVLSRGGVLLQAKRIVVHEGYRPAEAGPPSKPPANDVAIIEVGGDVPSDILPPPVAHPASEPGLMAASKEATVIGWGKNAFSKFATTSNYLHWTTVKVVTVKGCAKDYDGTDRIDNHTICAGSELADSCQGDSGGPLLMTDRKQEFFLVGLVSWGEGCARAGKPGVYMRVSQYFGWINANLVSEK